MPLSPEFIIGTVIALILAAIGVAVGVAVDAKTKGEFRFAAGCFSVSAAIVIYGIWMWQMTTTLGWPRLIVAFVLVALVLTGAGEAIRWAHGRHVRASGGDPEPHDQLAKESSNSVVLENIEVYKDYSTIEDGKDLAFRFTWVNHGPLKLREFRAISANMVIGAVPDESTLRAMFNTFRSSVDSARKDGITGPPVEIGGMASADLRFSPMGKQQTEAIANSDGRIYALIWTRWTDGDGLTGEKEYCRYLEKIGWKVTNMNLQMWQTCYPPPFTQAEIAPPATQRPSVSSKDWLDLSDRFKEVSWFINVHLHTASRNGRRVDTWRFIGGATESKKCEALCARAGIMLTKSPSASLGLSETVFGASTPAEKWLCFLRDSGAVRMEHNYGREEYDGGVTLHYLGSISEVAVVSSRICIECSNKEL